MATPIAEAVVELRASTEKFSKDLSNVRRDVETTAKQGSASFASMGTKIVALGAIVTTALSVKAITSFSRAALDAYKVQQDAEVKLATVIKATGGASGFTSGEMYKQAAALQAITTHGDEAIIGTQSIIATFKNVKGDEFKRATVAALDMATVMGSDAKSAALQLSKALNDPAKGLSMLTEAGVTFTTEQKKVVQELVNTGQVAKAQQLILAELESEFGGTAAAAAGTFSGSLLQLQNMVGDVMEIFGEFISVALAPFIGLLRDMTAGVLDNSSSLIDVLVPAIQAVLVTIKTGGVILNGFILMFEEVWNAGKLAFDQIALVAVTAFEAILSAAEKTFAFLGKMPGMLGAGFRSAAEGVGSVRQSLDNLKYGIKSTKDATIKSFDVIAVNAADRANKMDAVFAKANDNIIKAQQKRNKFEEKSNNESSKDYQVSQDEKTKAAQDAEKDRLKIVEKFNDDHNRATLDEYDYSLTKLAEKYDDYAAHVEDKKKLDEWYNSELGKITDAQAKKDKDAHDKQWAAFKRGVDDASGSAIRTWMNYDKEYSRVFDSALDQEKQRNADWFTSEEDALIRARDAAIESGADRTEVESDYQIKHAELATKREEKDKEAYAHAKEKAEEYTGSASAEGAALNSVWESIGKTAENTATGAFQKAINKIIEFSVSALGSMLAAGGGSAASFGEMTGGFAGAASEVGMFLAEALTGMAVARAMAKRADGGPIFDLGATGLLRKGTGPRSDDVLIRPNVLASKGEYVVNAKSTGANLALLEAINGAKGPMRFADGGPTSPQALSKRSHNLADMFTAGSSVAFVKGFVEGGIFGAIAEAIKFVGYATGAGMMTKAMGDRIKLADGGTTCQGGNCGCASCKAKKFANGGFLKFADGGMWAGHSPTDGHPTAGPGRGPDAAKLYALEGADRMRAIAEWQVAHGHKVESGGWGGTIGDVFGGGIIDPFACIETLTNPSKAASDFWESIKTRVTSGFWPITDELVKPGIHANMGTNIAEGIARHVLEQFDMSDLLGGCAPQFADGGIVTRPTMAMIGEEPGSPGEAVLPLKRGADGKLGVAGSGGGVTINVNGSLVAQNELIDIIENALNKRARLTHA